MYQSDNTGAQKLRSICLSITDQFDRNFTRMNWKIFKAAASGNVEYLRQSADPNLVLDRALTPQKNTVLHIAVEARQKEFAEQVIGLCRSLLFKPNIKGESPLHLAASTGCVELVELLISSAKLRDEDVESQGHHVINAVEDLLRMVNVEMKETAMHISLRKGHVDVMRSLMKADTGLLDFLTSADESPLYLAVWGGFTDLVTHILETCPLSPCGGPKRTNALHAAIYKKNNDIMKILAEKRAATIKEADMFGWTPFHYAAYFDNLPAVKVLLQFDSSAAYLSDKDGISPLHIAAFRGKVDIARELIKCCPYIWESRDEKGWTVLHAAVVGRKRKLVKYILSLPDLARRLINEPDKDGNTPLHMSVICGSHIIISILENQKGVDMFAMNKEWFTAADIWYSILKKDNFRRCFYKFYKFVAPFPSKDPGYPLVQQGMPHVQIQSWVDKEYRSILKGYHLITKQEKKNGVTVEGSGDSSRGLLENHLIVAVLVATVSFAAVFTMPGGYNDSKDTKPGMPTLMDKPGFKFFVGGDMVAFVSSTIAVFILFCSSAINVNYSPEHLVTNVAVLFIVMAMLGMTVAFFSAMFLSASEYIPLVFYGFQPAIPVGILCLFVLLLLNSGIRNKFVQFL